MRIPLALVGCGRWGKRLARALSWHDAFSLVAVVDSDPVARAWARESAPNSLGFSDIRALVRADVAGAAVVATPTPSHADIAECLLEGGLDVLVEKPLARSAADAARLSELCASSGRVGMVGHILRFAPSTNELVRLCRSGALGAIEEVTAVRATQSGGPDALWTLGPHELATLQALDMSRIVSCAGELEGDAITARLSLASGVKARFSWSTRAARPMRRTIVRGTLGSVTLDELDAGAPIRLVCSAHAATSVLPLSASAAPPARTPLELELDHFAASIGARTRPVTDFAEGARVVGVLERIERSIVVPAPRVASHG